MKNVRIIKTGIKVNKFIKQLAEYPDDWGNQYRIGNGRLDPEKNIVTANILQLVMGVVEDPSIPIGDSELCMPTDAYYNHTEIISFLKRNFQDFRRCGYLALPVGNVVGQHIDEGTYYLTKDRYHLSIQGVYEYTVGDETVRVEPGTLLWFNNKEMHGTVNVGDVPRITFVFDIPHNKRNP